MVALEEDRTRLLYVAVDLASGGTVTFDIVVNLHPVEDDRNAIANNRRFDGLPFAGRPGDELIRRLEIVNRPVASGSGLAAVVIA